MQANLVPTTASVLAALATAWEAEAAKEAARAAWNLKWAAFGSRLGF